MRESEDRFGAASDSRNAFDETAGQFSALIPADPGQSWIEERTRVGVARNNTVSGKLIFTEPVRIEGRFRGEVRSADLVVISQDGIVEGKVCARRLLVLGELRGDVTGGERVVLGPRARVYGNIEAHSLSVREGAHLDGHIRMTGVEFPKQ